MKIRLTLSMVLLVLSVLLPFSGQARFYDPSNGRFNQMDTFAGNNDDPQSLHKYLYVHAGKLPPPKTLSQLVRKAYQKGLTGDAMWKSVYESSMRSNAGVDARFQYGDAAVPFYLWDAGGD